MAGNIYFFFLFCFFFFADLRRQFGRVYARKRANAAHAAASAVRRVCLRELARRSRRANERAFMPESLQLMDQTECRRFYEVHKRSQSERAANGVKVKRLGLFAVCKRRSSLLQHGARRAGRLAHQLFECALARAARPIRAAQFLRRHNSRFFHPRARLFESQAAAAFRLSTGAHTRRKYATLHAVDSRDARQQSKAARRPARRLANAAVALASNDC